MGGSGRISGWVGVQPPPPPPGWGGTLWGPLGLSSHLCERLGLLYCMSQLGTWVRGWVGGCQTPPPPPRVGHLSVCGYAKILGGWVPELTPPPPRVAKQNPVRNAPQLLQHHWRKVNNNPCPSHLLIHLKEKY